MDKLILASKRFGKGKETAAIIMIICSLLASLMGIVMFFGTLGDDSNKSFMVISIVLFVIGIWQLINGLKNYGVAISFVDIYSNKIKGKSFVKTLFFTENKDFEMDFNEIKNIDTSGNYVILYTSYATYNCSALNADEIKATIKKIINQN